jgi:four helix bundle protein
MTPRHFTELRCWQLADELRREVVAICAIERVRRRRRFCDSFEDAAGSVCRNISEGFARFDSGPIVQFFGYALGSLQEVEDHLRSVSLERSSTSPAFDRLWDLAEHTKATTLNFKRTHEKPEHEKPTRKRVRKKRPPDPSAPNSQPNH